MLLSSESIEKDRLFIWRPDEDVPFTYITLALQPMTLHSIASFNRSDTKNKGGGQETQLGSPSDL